MRPASASPRCSAALGGQTLPVLSPVISVGPLTATGEAVRAGEEAGRVVIIEKWAEIAHARLGERRYLPRTMRSPWLFGGLRVRVPFLGWSAVMVDRCHNLPRSLSSACRLALGWGVGHERRRRRTDARWAQEVGRPSGARALDCPGPARGNRARAPERCGGCLWQPRPGALRLRLQALRSIWVLE